jgi:hypothetical protein
MLLNARVRRSILSTDREERLISDKDTELMAISDDRVYNETHFDIRVVIRNQLHHHDDTTWHS